MRNAPWCIFFAVFTLAGTGAFAADQLSDGVDIDPGVKPAKGEDSTVALKPVDGPKNVNPEIAPEFPAVAPVKPKSVFAIEMEDFTSSGLMNEKSRKAYDLAESLKKQITQVSQDLDGGGKERTRLIQTSELIAKGITQISELWPADEDLITSCASSKRYALVLEEQLQAEPRRWTHVRIAFSELQKEVAELRRKAVALAEDEPKPIVGKDGKLIVVEAAHDPVEMQRKAAERRRKVLEAQKDRLKKFEEAKKKDDDEPAVRTELPADEPPKGKGK